MADDRQSYATQMVAEAERLIAAGKVRRAIRKLEAATAATTLSDTELFERIHRAADAAAEAEGERHAKQAALLKRIVDAREASLRGFAARHPNAVSASTPPRNVASDLRVVGVALAIGGLVLGLIMGLALRAADQDGAALFATHAIDGAPSHFNWLFFFLALGPGVAAGSAFYAAGAVVAALEATK